MEIAYPLFKLGIRKPETIDGVMFYLNQYENDGEDPSTRIKVIDDRNESGATLALRRLKLKVANIDLFKINKAIYFVGDLIKLATPHTWFIDSNGRLFNYLKTSKAKLKFHKIKDLIPIKGGGVIIETVDLTTRFKALYVPNSINTHIGVLHFGKSLILYGFYDKAYSETWRSL